MHKLVFLFLFFTLSGNAFGQKFDFKKINRDSLNTLNSEAQIHLIILAENQFKINEVEGDYAAQKAFLKSYILEKKERANIGVANKKEIDFEKYQKCFFEVSLIYEEIWEEEAQRKHSKPFSECTVEQKQEIVQIYPVKFH